MKYWVFIILTQLNSTLHVNAHQILDVNSINYTYAVIKNKSPHYQEDLVDVFEKIIKHKDDINVKKDPKKVFISLVPAAGYSLSSGFAGLISGNAAFYMGKSKDQNISSIYTSASYSTLKQKIFNIGSNIWTKDNKYNLVGEWRYLLYQQPTYGLGTQTSEKKANTLIYSYIRIYETILKKIKNDFFIGGGYNFDYHFNVIQLGNIDSSISDFQKYGFNNKTISSGLNFTILFDNRRNSINPTNGFYGNLIYRYNSNIMGSDQNWHSLSLDIRKYFKLSPASNNVLAFWSLSWLTLKGTPPYLDLPSTGWDSQGNTGRGYVQSRYRGKDMLYLESEYRFAVTSNGLLGGVLFVNAQSFLGYPNNQFQNIVPGVGTGIRIKLNKHSNTNVCLDYGWGVNGSRGWFVNLGEVF
ncbi:MAG: hypothetical protein NVS1B13_24910 [Flavisolibacter sp.]